MSLLLFTLLISNWCAAAVQADQIVDPSLICGDVENRISCLNSKMDFLIYLSWQINPTQIISADSQFLNFENEIFSSASPPLIPKYCFSEGKRFGGPKDHSSSPGLISSLNSRIGKLENELVELKEKSLQQPPTNFEDFRLEFEALKNSVKEAEAKIEKCEAKIEKCEAIADADAPLLPVIEDEDNTCNLVAYHRKSLESRSVIHYLQKINFNLFHRKPVNTSSEFGKNWIALYGIDGDMISRYSSKYEANPWFILDLEGPHLIWQITFTTFAINRVIGVNIYMADKLTFDFYNKPKVKEMSLFATFTGRPKSLNVNFRHPGGMCGRYVVIVREGNKVDLSFFELEAVGISL